MRKIRKMASTLLVMLSIALIGGCGKKDDQLHMVTTEHITEVEETTEDPVDQEIEQMEEESRNGKTTEAALQEDKLVTLSQIKTANSGDSLLVDGKSVSINRIYYGDEGEAASEYEFLGFDEDGNYTQVYENSEGYVQVYDKINNYWYVFTGDADDKKTLTLIYPEDDIASYLVENNHTETFFSCPSTAVIRDIYRQEGNLVMEVESSDDSELYVAYTLDENLRVLEMTTYYTEDGSKYNYCFTDLDAKYEFPEFVSNMKNDEARRAINVVYVNEENGFGGVYDVSATNPVDFRTTGHSIYMDEACTVEWAAEYDKINSLGFYEDLTIYIQ